MKYLIRLSFSITLFSLLISCGGPEKNPVNDSRFFNLNGYFNEQVAELEKLNTPITKTIMHNGKTETITEQNVDWNTELKPFLEIDITLPAHILSYSIDSLVEGNSTTLYYTAKDSTPLLRNIVIKLNNGNPDSIYIRKVISNSYVSSMETMSYFGNGNYELKVHNDPQIGKNIAFELKGVAGNSVIN